MTKFGQYLEREAIAEWRDKYMHYNELKKLLKAIEKWAAKRKKKAADAAAGIDVKADDSPVTPPLSDVSIMSGGAAPTPATIKRAAVAGTGTGSGSRTNTPALATRSLLDLSKPASDSTQPIPLASARPLPLFDLSAPRTPKLAVASTFDGSGALPPTVPAPTAVRRDSPTAAFDLRTRETTDEAAAAVAAATFEIEHDDSPHEEADHEASGDVKIKRRHSPLVQALLETPTPHHHHRPSSGSATPTVSSGGGIPLFSLNSGGTLATNARLKGIASAHNIVISVAPTPKGAIAATTTQRIGSNAASGMGGGTLLVPVRIAGSGDSPPTAPSSALQSRRGSFNPNAHAAAVEASAAVAATNSDYQPPELTRVWSETSVAHNNKHVPVDTLLEAESGFQTPPNPQPSHSHALPVHQRWPRPIATGTGAGLSFPARATGGMVRSDSTIELTDRAIASVVRPASALRPGMGAAAKHAAPIAEDSSGRASSNGAGVSAVMNNTEKPLPPPPSGAPAPTVAAIAWKLKRNLAFVLVKAGTPAEKEEKAFFHKLTTELEMVNEFFLIQLKTFSEQLQQLQLQITPDLNRAERGTLRRLGEELYRGLRILENYRILNWTGFVKIMKKHDKMSIGLKHASESVIPVIHSSVFWRSHDAVHQLMNDTEAFYVDAFVGMAGGAGGDDAGSENGDPEEMNARRKQAIGKLRGDSPKVSHWTTFKFGLCMGLTMAMLAAIVFVWMYAPTFANSPLFLYSFPIFRGLSFILLAVWGWGCTTYLCTHYKINYQFILEVDMVTRLDFHHIWELASFFTFLFLGCIGLFSLSVWSHLEDSGGMDSTGGPFFPINPGLWHFGAFLTLIIVTFWPFDHFYRATRVFFLSALWRIIWAPFYPVGFIDFFLADQLCSMVRVLFDFTYGFCFYTSSAFLDGDDPVSAGYCSALTKRAQFVLALLPYWWRLMQCVRRYRDSGQRWPHLANAAKYGSSMLVNLFNTFRALGYGGDALVGVWIVLACIGTGFSMWWDLRMDWGLFEANAPNRFLRKELVIPQHAWYFVAVVADVLLRVSWLFSISPGSYGDKYEFVVFAIGAAEIFRRSMWNVFRLENEHLNNVGAFRLVHAVPLVVRLPPPIRFKAPAVPAAGTGVASKLNRAGGLVIGAVADGLNAVTAAILPSVPFQRVTPLTPQARPTDPPPQRVPVAAAPSPLLAATAPAPAAPVPLINLSHSGPSTTRTLPRPLTAHSRNLSTTFGIPTTAAADEPIEPASATDLAPSPFVSAGAPPTDIFGSEAAAALAGAAAAGLNKPTIERSSSILTRLPALMFPRVASTHQMEESGLRLRRAPSMGSAAALAVVDTTVHPSHAQQSRIAVESTEAVTPQSAAAACTPLASIILRSVTHTTPAATTSATSNSVPPPASASAPFAGQPVTSWDDTRPPAPAAAPAAAAAQTTESQPAAVPSATVKSNDSPESGPVVSAAVFDARHPFANT